METPVLVNKVDGETHEGVASGRRPHVRGEGSAREVSLDGVDYIKDLFLDLGCLHLHHLGVGGPVLEIHSLVEQ